MLPIGDYSGQPVNLVFKLQKPVQWSSWWSLLQPVGDGILAAEVELERRGRPLRSGPRKCQ